MVVITILFAYLLSDVLYYMNKPFKLVLIRGIIFCVSEESRCNLQVKNLICIYKWQPCLMFGQNI